MKKTYLFLLTLMITPAAPGFTLMGSALIKQVATEDLSSLRYSIKTPFVDINDVWIRFDLSIMNTSDYDPENPLCGLRLNFREETLYDRAYYEDGALYLYFDQLEGGTLLEFVVGWNKPDNGAIFPHSAAVSVESDVWDETAEWNHSVFSMLVGAQPAQIVIDGSESCYFL